MGTKNLVKQALLVQQRFSSAHQTFPWISLRNCFQFPISCVCPLFDRPWDLSFSLLPSPEQAFEFQSGAFPSKRRCRDLTSSSIARCKLRRLQRCFSLCENCSPAEKSFCRAASLPKNRFLIVSYHPSRRNLTDRHDWLIHLPFSLFLAGAPKSSW